MLTLAQKEIRRSGVGASEIAAIAGLNPWKGPVDIWMRKPTPTRGPLVEEEDEETPLDLEDRTKLRKRLGDHLEDGLRALYSEMTGNKVLRSGETFRHPEIPYILASPDGLPVDPSDPDAPGLEIKVVGARVAHHWEDDSLPDYVRAQTAQNMAVLGRRRWDVLALIGGTDPRLYRLERDADLEGSLVEAGVDFWISYVLGDRCPPPVDPDEAKRYLQMRYPGSDASACLPVDTEQARGLVQRLADAKARKAEAETEERAVQAELFRLVGDNYGVQGPWGKFLWIPKRGAVSYKAIAEELAGGVLPEKLVEKHRGEPFRSPAFYPYKAKKESSR